jgi:hypothetical protein
MDEAREQELAGSDASFVEASRRQRRPEARIRCSSQAGVRRLNSSTFASTAESRSAPLVRGMTAALPGCIEGRQWCIAPALRQLQQRCECRFGRRQTPGSRPKPASAARRATRSPSSKRRSCGSAFVARRRAAAALDARAGARSIAASSSRPAWRVRRRPGGLAGAQRSRALMIHRAVPGEGPAGRAGSTSRRSQRRRGLRRLSPHYRVRSPVRPSSHAADRAFTIPGRAGRFRSAIGWPG